MAEFPSSRWPVKARDEITSEVFEDIRKALFRRMKVLGGGYTYDEWDIGDTPYPIGHAVMHNDILYVSVDETSDEPPSGDWARRPTGDDYSEFGWNSPCQLEDYAGGEWIFYNAWQRFPIQTARINNLSGHETRWELGQNYTVGTIRRICDALDIEWEYIVIVPHTSTVENHPTGEYGEIYWKAYGEPTRVNQINARKGGWNCGFISDNIGAWYTQYVGAGAGEVGFWGYFINYGCPDEDSINWDPKFYEYQSAVEHISAPGPWAWNYSGTWKRLDQRGVESNWNGFEEILRLLGGDHYDWYLDTAFYPRTVDGDDPNHAGWHAHPVWRRTWKHTMKTPSFFYHLRDDDAERPFDGVDDWHDAGWDELPWGTDWTYTGTVSTANYDSDTNITTLALNIGNWTIDSYCLGGDIDITDSGSYLITEVTDGTHIKVEGDASGGQGKSYAIFCDMNVAFPGFINSIDWKDDTWGDATKRAACIKRHTYASWCKNPSATMMNHMRDVLLKLKYFIWVPTASLQTRTKATTTYEGLPTDTFGAAWNIAMNTTTGDWGAGDSVIALGEMSYEWLGAPDNKWRYGIAPCFADYSETIGMRLRLNPLPANLQFLRRVGSFTQWEVWCRWRGCAHNASASAGGFSVSGWKPMTEWVYDHLVTVGAANWDDDYSYVNIGTSCNAEVPDPEVHTPPEEGEVGGDLGCDAAIQIDLYITNEHPVIITIDYNKVGLT